MVPRLGSKWGLTPLYKQAAFRHWDDACRLGDASRYDNASHLVGFAVECALKEHLQLAGAVLDRVHMPELLTLYKLRMKGRRARAADVAPLSSGPHSFADWHVSDRYSADGYVQEETWKGRKLKAGRFFAASGLMRSS